MAKQESTYRQIFKATGIFGGVQVFNILINIAKSKIIAILLGPSGIGLFGMFNATLDVLKSVTGLGISTSAVKEVSEAAGTEDITRISQVLKTLRRCMYLTGVLGGGVTLLLAPQLSQWTFGNEGYTWAFYWLSVVLFFNALSAGQTTALQGLRQIGFLAKAGMLGSLLGLCLSIPLFYFLGERGVVLSIILSSICGLIFSAYYAQRIPQVKVQQSIKESLKRGGTMARLGIALMFGNLLAVLAGYVLKAYISRHGGIDDMGLYQSAFSIAEGYFGLIFAAMATDYFPRLAAVNHDNAKLNSEVNKQAEIGLLIAFPCITIALFFTPVAIPLLYSKQFVGAIECVNWALLGNLFKIGSWTMGYVLIAKGKSKLFAFTSITFNSIYLLLTIYGYRLWGVTGVGIAFLLYYMVHFVGIGVLVSQLFSICLKRVFFKLFTIVLVLSGAAFCLQSIAADWLKYSGAVVLCLTSFYISYRQLDKRLQLREFIHRKLHRK